MDPAQQSALLFDAVQCAGSRRCVVACKEVHGFPVPDDPEEVRELDARTYTCMWEEEDYALRNLCRHCLDPACASVCPVGALHKTARGPVVYDVEKCIGCRYCMVACPFNIPRYEWDSPVPQVRKCDMCIDRQREGKQPACAEVCPEEATVFGTRAELLELARRRIRESPDEYDDHIYGEREVGGTSVLFLLPKNFASLGFDPRLGREPLPHLTWRVLSGLPHVSLGVAATLLGFWWITHRRNEVAQAEREAARRRPGGNGKERSHEDR